MSDLVVEADVDEVSVLQARGLEDRGEVAAQVVAPDDVILSAAAPTAETQHRPILTQQNHTGSWAVTECHCIGCCVSMLAGRHCFLS